MAVAVSIYFLAYNKPSISNKKHATYKAELSDIKAGSNKAILTLSDGRIIVFDSDGSGVVANEGDMQNFGGN